MDKGTLLYRRFLDGDRKAFEEIVDLYADNLIFFINRYVKNLSLAEDISEDVFVEVLMHRHRYNFKASFKTYLFAVARHKALDSLRRLARHPETDYGTIENLSGTQSTEEQFLKQEKLRAMHRCLDTLNDDYKTVLHLIYFEEMSNEDTAKVMKKSKKQIENLAYRAKQALKIAMEKEGYADEKQR